MFFTRSLRSLLLRSFACRPAPKDHVKTLIRNSLQPKGYTRKRRTIFEHNDARTQRKSTASRHKHVSLSLPRGVSHPQGHMGNSLTDTNKPSCSFNVGEFSSLENRNYNPRSVQTLVTAPAEVSIMTNADQSQWCVLTKQMGGEIQMPPLPKLGLQLIISVL